MYNIILWYYFVIYLRWNVCRTYNNIHLHVVQQIWFLFDALVCQCTQVMLHEACIWLSSNLQLHIHLLDKLALSKCFGSIEGVVDSKHQVPLPASGLLVKSSVDLVASILPPVGTFWQGCNYNFVTTYSVILCTTVKGTCVLCDSSYFSDKQNIIYTGPVERHFITKYYCYFNHYWVIWQYFGLPAKSLIPVQIDTCFLSKVMYSTHSWDSVCFLESEKNFVPLSNNCFAVKWTTGQV